MNKIITLTLNPCIDKTIWIDQLIPEKKLKAKHPEDEPGGGGINVSRAIHYLEEKSTAIYFSGSYNGQYLNKLIQAESIDFIDVAIADNTRMNIMLIDESNLLEYRIGIEGPQITEQEINNLLAIIEQQKDYDFFVVSGSLPPTVPPNFYAKIAKIVEANNAKLIVDTSGTALQETIKERVYLLKPNLNELSLLCGISESASIKEIIAATQQLLSTINCNIIVVSLGKNGAVLVTNTAFHHILPPSIKVKSTVGAGDCMVAGLTLALSKNKSLKEVLQFGIACGSAATLYSGKGLCKKKDVEMLYHQIAINTI
jgi:6-phosphofructokinase 2